MINVALIVRIVGLLLLFTVPLSTHAVDTLLKGGTVINAAQSPRQADVRISNGIITAIGELDPLPGEQVLDVSERLLLPGGIDPHVHIVGEPTPLTMVDDYTVEYINRYRRVGYRTFALTAGTGDDNFFQVSLGITLLCRQLPGVRE